MRLHFVCEEKKSETRSGSRNKRGRSTTVLWVGRKPEYQPTEGEADRLTGPIDGFSLVDSRMGGHSRRFVWCVVPGERSGLEELQCVLDTFLLDEPSQAPSRHPDPRKRYCQLLPCVFEERACPYDVVPGLQDGGVVVVLALVTRAKEEGGGLVLVLPNVAFEVLSCGSMVSAHLSQGRHGTSVDFLEPLGWPEFEEVGCLACSREGEEARLGPKDLLVLIFQVVKEAAPFLERHGFHFGESGGAGDKVGEKVARVAALFVGSGTCVLVGGFHLVQTAMARGPEKVAGDVGSVFEYFDHVLTKHE